MQPNQQQPDNWQQPAESPSAAPFQAPDVPQQQQPVSPLPIAEAPQPAPVPPVYVQQPPAQPISATPVAVPQQPATPVEVPQPITEQPQAFDNSQQPDTGYDEQIEDENVAAFTDDAVLLRWQGTEYTHDSRSIKWYIIFGLIAVVAVIIAVVVLKSITFAILIPVMVVALLVYVRRPPEVLDYILSRKGLHVNDKLFTFDQFKAFGIATLNGAHSVTLIPRKRFQIGQTIYFPEDIGEQLVDMLAERLPMKEIEPDAIDKLLAKLHL